MTHATTAVVVFFLACALIPVEGLSYACVDCEEIPERLVTECEIATKAEMPCYQYNLMRGSLCHRTCRAVHRKPCRMKARICRGDPDCPHLCRKFFEFLCPLTEDRGLDETEVICPEFPQPGLAPANPLIAPGYNETAQQPPPEKRPSARRRKPPPTAPPPSEPTTDASLLQQSERFQPLHRRSRPKRSPA